MSPLLHAPILPTLARLAAPGMALALFQTAVSVADTYYIGRLGTEALAGLALVFPMVMLLQMTSAGAMGGGVSSAVARSLGAGNPDSARKLVAHALVMAVSLWQSALRPQREHWRLEGRLFSEILRVGAISSVSALQTVLTAVILTGFVARFGTEALAGYGVGVRLELLQVPIVFAIGQALVVMVGTNIGAGQGGRAKRIAWTGTPAAMLICLAIGWSVAIYPPLWINIFSNDAAVVEIGSLDMRSVAP